MIKINNWSVGGNNNPYIPPECRTLHLSGIVFNHPKIADGAQVTTSAIIDAKKRIVYTTSGSIYILGKISKSYRKYLHDIRPNWNWRIPITIIR